LVLEALAVLAAITTVHLEQIVFLAVLLALVVDLGLEALILLVLMVVLVEAVVAMREPLVQEELA
jgi:hypothetical protein